jgi:hypothetical protein
MPHDTTTQQTRSAEGTARPSGATTPCGRSPCSCCDCRVDACSQDEEIASLDLQIGALQHIRSRLIEARELERKRKLAKMAAAGAQR